MSPSFVIRHLAFLLLFVLPLTSQAAVALINTSETGLSATGNSFVTTLSLMTVDDLASVSKSDFKEKLGRNFKFQELVAFKVLRRQAKKTIKNNNASEAEGAQADGFAIASMVVGIVSIFFAGIILGAAALVFGLIALNRIKKDPEGKNGKGFAIAGIVTGVVGIVGALILLMV